MVGTRAMYPINIGCRSAYRRRGLQDHPALRPCAYVARLQTVLPGCESGYSKTIFAGNSSADLSEPEQQEQAMDAESTVRTLTVRTLEICMDLDHMRLPASLC